jgi:hypothetical protein
VLALLGGHYPAANWGGVNQSPQALWDHVTAAQYRIYVTDMDAVAFLNRVRAWLSMMLTDFAVVSVVPLVIGIGVMGVRLKRLLVSSLLWLIPLMIFTTLYTAQDTAAVYSGPLHVIAALCIAFGLVQIVERLPAYHHAAAIAFVLIYATLLLIGNFLAVNLAQDRQPQQFLQDALAVLPAEAIVITNSDQETFTLWYYHFVEGCCDDLVIVDKRLLRYDWYRENLSRLYPFLPDAFASVDQWLSDEQLATYTIVSSTFLLPAGGRQVRRAGDWYISPPAAS